MHLLRSLDWFLLTAGKPSDCRSSTPSSSSTRSSCRGCGAQPTRCSVQCLLHHILAACQLPPLLHRLAVIDTAKYSQT
jgi:hypothetical protein